LLGCNPIAISGARLTSLRNALDGLDRLGAYSCAPREFALARANYAFARSELTHGDALRAQEHLIEAEENVGAAQVLTPQADCQPTPTAASAVNPPRPATADADRDGVPDAVDRCPDEAEDKRGPLDADGCKAADADGDGIIDAVDACPNEAEDRDGNADDDGCPDVDAVANSDANDKCAPDASSDCSSSRYPDVTIGERELRLGVSIVFSGDSANLRGPASFTVLDTVARILKDHPRITLEIAAHTDSRGDEARNYALSQQQAESVRKYLVEHGVEASRLTARGYGETRPIESNSTSRGRAINRRIEFTRTDRAP
jgi:outer membrane protein OmpA-like peptidoglycan-associated protein